MQHVHEKVRVAVVGATGLAGQQFLAALAQHPIFEVVKLAASARSAGRPYAEAIRDDSGRVAWYADGALDPALAAIEVEPAERLDPGSVDLVFTAIEAEPARALEPRYAAVVPVLSTASAFRYEEDVPLLLPGVNLEQAELLRQQSRRRGWKGFILPNPNCTTVGLAMTLAPLHRAFGVQHVHMVSMQAVSGAGRSPGVIALDSIDNIVPFIPKEEDKVARETRKILGTLRGEHIEPAGFGVSCTCTRVSVLEGHTEAVHVQLDREVDADAIAAAWRGFGSELVAEGHPSCPPALIHVHDDPYRPQVRLDRDMNKGMTTVVGRLRPDPDVPRGWKYMLVSHNTKMGAARGCILMAEYLHAHGFLAARG
jgi:aspartate-semialdehyde dehydrogenase